MFRLENWSIVDQGNKTKLLYGEVFGHDVFPDGTRIRSKKILVENHKDGIITTENAEYKLGSKKVDS